MTGVHVRYPVTPGDVATLRRVAERARSADDGLHLDDEAWDDLADPARPSAAVLAGDPDDPLAAAVVTAAEGADDHRFNVELVRGRDHDQLVGPLLGAAAEHARSLGGRRLQLWAFGADEADDEHAAANGLRPERELWQMRVPLPIPQTIHWPTGLRLRAFEPGNDDPEWLAANNDAFAADPDQGGWTGAELARRRAEPWFDARGFLLAVDEAAPGTIAGFCWTKIHPPAPPAEPEALGEIYVIGARRAYQGRGLGRALVLAGLDSLHDRGMHLGMLYVDSTNTAAIGLYRALGFVVARVDRAYARELA